MIRSEDLHDAETNCIGGPPYWMTLAAAAGLAAPAVADTPTRSGSGCYGKALNTTSGSTNAIAIRHRPHRHGVGCGETATARTAVDQ
jgi:hypothetical protein